jgi:hypothetical protein
MLDGSMRGNLCFFATVVAPFPENASLSATAGIAGAPAPTPLAQDRGPTKGPHDHARPRMFREQASGRIHLNLSKGSRS